MLSINVFLVPLQIDYKLDIHCIGGPDNILHDVKGGMQNKLVEMRCLVFLHAKQRVRTSSESSTSLLHSLKNTAFHSLSAGYEHDK